MVLRILLNCPSIKLYVYGSYDFTQLSIYTFICLLLYLILHLQIYMPMALITLLDCPSIELYVYGSNDLTPLYIHRIQN